MPPDPPLYVTCPSPLPPPPLTSQLAPTPLHEFMPVAVYHSSMHQGPCRYLKLHISERGGGAKLYMGTLSVSISDEAHTYSGTRHRGNYNVHESLQEMLRRQSNTTQLAQHSHFSKKNWLPWVGLKTHDHQLSRRCSYQLS